MMQFHVFFFSDLKQVCLEVSYFRYQGKKLVNFYLDSSFKNEMTPSNSRHEHDLWQTQRQLKNYEGDVILKR